MSARTILTLANGKGIDLLAPAFVRDDLLAIAEHLSKEIRFNGATPGVTYSVAEHCCRGSDAALATTKDQATAAYFLLHDAHEALLKDDTTPKKQALAEHCEIQFGLLAEHIIAAWKSLEYRMDAAIHATAGLTWPPSSAIQTAIKHWDKVMFVTEWRDLMGAQEHPDWTPYQGVTALKERINSPWNAMTAQHAFIRRCRSLLPAFQHESAGKP